jgi:hypothetical protein
VIGVLAELFEWAERGKFYRDHWEDKDAASVPHMLARQAEDHPAPGHASCNMGLTKQPRTHINIAVWALTSSSSMSN